MVEQNKERQKSMSNILLLEDDLSLINGLSFAFKKQGFELNIARTLKEAEELWTDGKYDLLVLDVSLPDGSGFEFCKRVRLTSKVPIIFLTASDEETSIIMGLDIGGDDYITKPFKLGVLVSRINALLRRANSFQAADTELQSNGIKVLLLQGQVFKNGELLDLTAAEYKLLCLFMRNPSMVLTKGQILDGGLKILPHGPPKTWGEPCGTRYERCCGVMTAAPAETCCVPIVRGRGKYDE